MNVDFRPESKFSIDNNEAPKLSLEFQEFLKQCLELAYANPYGHGLEWKVLQELALRSPVLNLDEIFAALNTVKEILQSEGYDLKLLVSILIMLMRPLIISPHLEDNASLQKEYMKGLYENFSIDDNSGLFNRSLLGACFLYISFKEELLKAHEGNRTVPLIKICYDLLACWDEKEGGDRFLSNLELVSKLIAEANQLKILKAEMRVELGLWLSALMTKQVIEGGYIRLLKMAGFSLDESTHFLLTISSELKLNKRLIIWNNLLDGINEEEVPLIFLKLEPIHQAIQQLTLEDQKKATALLFDEFSYILCKATQKEIEKEIFFVTESKQLSTLLKTLSNELKWLQLCNLTENGNPSIRIFFKSYIFRRAIGIAFHKEHSQHAEVQNYLFRMFTELEEELNYPLSETETAILLNLFFDSRPALDIQNDQLLKIFFRKKFDIHHRVRSLLNEYSSNKIFHKVPPHIFIKGIKKFKSLDKKEGIEHSLAVDILIAAVASKWTPKALALIKAHQKSFKWPTTNELEQLVANHIDSLENCSLEQGIETVTTLINSYSFSESLLTKFLINLGSRERFGFIKTSSFEKFMHLYKILKKSNKELLLLPIYERLFSAQVDNSLNFKEIYQALVDPDSLIFNPVKLEDFFNQLKVFLISAGKKPEISHIAYALLLCIGKGLVEIPKQMIKWEHLRLSLQEKNRGLVALERDSIAALDWSSVKRTLLRLMQICYERLESDVAKDQGIFFLRQQIALLERYGKYCVEPRFCFENVVFKVVEESGLEIKWD